MNFFEHQDQARKKTKQLLFLFLLAVLSLIALTTLLVAAFLGYLTPMAEQVSINEHIWAQLNNGTLIKVALSVVSIIGLGTLYKLYQLSDGGKVVAEMLGGKLVKNSTNDLNQRKLLNVVEEMAIASGSPVPPVYLLPSHNINAFAAGFNFNDAVIGVTQGCIEQLNRDELQGVIAHEFSHIFHGDMRINMRLIGTLHGILLIGLIGRYLIDKFWLLNNRNKDKGSIGIIAFAFGLMIIGFGGLFFGNLIKSSISRQREFLADASAVKFTRNPDGISNALKRIGGNSSGARLFGKHIGEASHLFFGEAIYSFFATHPPLADRIKRIQPAWDGKYIPRRIIKKESSQQQKEKQPQKDRTKNATIATTVIAAQAIATQALEDIGNHQSKHLDYAHKLLELTPRLWLEQAHSTSGAKAVIYALLIDQQSIDIAQKQYQSISRVAPLLLPVTQQLIATELKLEYRLTLIDIALPQLAEMPKLDFDKFELLLDNIINADQNIDIFEWILSAVVMHYLKPLYGKITPPKSQHRHLNDVAKSCQIIFSALAIAGHSDPQQQRRAFQAATTAAELENLHLFSLEYLTPKLLNLALKELNKLYPLLKPLFLKSAIACIYADGKITPNENELIRAIADTLDSPMPPIII